MTLDAIVQQEKVITPFSHKISYSDLKREHFFSDKVSRQIQIALLATSVICGVLSLIPGVGFYGSLVLRSVVVIGAGVACVDGWKKNGIKGFAFQLLRVAFVAIGLAGVAFHQKIFVLTALAGDIAFQNVEALCGLRQKDLVKALSHFAIMIINAFAIAAFVTGMWEYLVTASAISTVTMAGFCVKSAIQAYKKKDWTLAFEAICYGALTVTGMAGTISSSALYNSRVTNYHYTFKNNENASVTLYDNQGHVIAVIKPGDTISFSLDADQTMSDFRGVDRGYITYSIDGSKNTNVLNPDSREWQLYLYNRAIAPDDFANLPVGGTSMVATDHSMIERSLSALSFENQGILNDLLKGPAPLDSAISHIVQDKRKITLYLEGAPERTYQFYREILCKHSGYFATLLTTTMRENGECEFPLEMEETNFELLMSYFKNSNLLQVRSLKEDELIQLYETAEYLDIERLRGICVQEIGKRVDEGRWKKIDLLKPFQNQIYFLSKLVNLYNFG